MPFCDMASCHPTTRPLLAGAHLERQQSVALESTVRGPRVFLWSQHRNDSTRKERAFEGDDRSLARFIGPFCVDGAFRHNKHALPSGRTLTSLAWRLRGPFTRLTVCRGWLDAAAFHQCVDSAYNRDHHREVPKHDEKFDRRG